MSRSDTAAVIVTHNRAEWLRGALRSLHSQRPDVPAILVVDDGSTDHTLAVAQQESPDAQVIRVPKATGWSAARNLAARSIEHEVLFCLDDDSTLDANAMSLAVEAMRSHPRVAAVQPTIIENGKPLRTSANGQRVFTNMCIGQGVFSRRAFLEVGMYDPGVFYAEEMDFSLRLLEAGYDIVFDPAIVVYHGIDQQTRRAHSGHVEVHRNMLRVVLKRAPWPLLLPWAAKKTIDIAVAATRAGGLRMVFGELTSLPVVWLRGLRERRPMSWQIFAVWRYLSTRVVATPDYRERALQAIPSVGRLLIDYLLRRQSA